MPELSPAPGRLRILMLEDNDGDAALIRRALARTTPRADVRWAKSRADFVEELAGFPPHVVLSDYNVPGISGLEALAMVRDQSPATPFILISGTIGEETAVEALKSGVTDYVLKSHLARLETVLTRALRERRQREDRIAAEAALVVTQAQLLQSQKMEALGRLSGGIAHDFNNILTAITGYSELALLNPKLDGELRADIKEVLNAAFRAAALTKQLLAFSRRQLFTPKILDLNAKLAELDRMLQRIIGEDVKLTIIASPGICRVRVDADQIGQVMMNLVVNARDAMPKGGIITLRTSGVELDAAAVRGQPDIEPGSFVRTTVADNGVGMDAETLSRIFEPFFTTKGSGTGLGLSTVYGIVKQSRGFLEVKSRLGKGSVFSVYLPCAAGELDPARALTTPESLRGSETILVVDDDAAVGVVARRILEPWGYKVLSAQSGAHALSLCADRGNQVRLLMTDVVMAGMNGPEVARRVKGALPGCAILFVSGYAEGELSEMSAERGNFVTKPFTVEELLRKVRQALDRPHSYVL